MADEFKLIRDIFSNRPPRREAVALGIGDDAAVLNIPADRQLVIGVDTTNIGVHFPADTPARDIGHKSLAVALSDLAAMGAEPLAATLSLSLPQADKQWLADFARGFFRLAARHDTQLIGGDTTRGRLSVSVAALGTVPKGKALRRRGARRGDLIYVTGALGAAAAALLMITGALNADGRRGAGLLRRLRRPAPAVAAGLLIRDFATACIDISDGLAADLGHILDQSAVGARLSAAAIPLSAALRGCLGRLNREDGLQLALHGGDDYELCFTVPPAKQAALESAASENAVAITRIGAIEPAAGLRLTKPDGTTQTIEPRGYRHFKKA